MKNVFAVAFGLLIGGGFIYLIYKYLPLGMALAITGGCFGVSANFPDSKITYWVGTVGSWLMPIGVIIAFFQNGFLTGLLTIPAGFVAYSLGKPRH